jgi:hypothetical protein
VGIFTLAKRYRRARKKEKGRILDELVALSGYNRWYAVGLLRGQGTVIKVGRRLRLVGELRRSTKRRRPRIYDGVVLEWLKKIWTILDFICGKRLVTALRRISVQMTVKIMISIHDGLVAASRPHQPFLGRSASRLSIIVSFA